MSNIALGQEMSSLDLGLKQAAYTGVTLIAGQNDSGENIEYTVGNTTGNVLEINVPNGTREMAQAVLDGLKLRGFQYQPFDSEATYTDPAIEIGDSVSVGGSASVVHGYELSHSRLMAPTLKAPYDEEVDHEFKWEARAERQFKRESAYTRSRLTINADSIEAKVSKTGGDASSFAWLLTDSSWELKSNNSTVFKVNSSGAEVYGKITATSGYIGNGSSGFEIGSTFIRNGMISLSDTSNNGIYIGTDGISLGKGKFKVDSSGNLTASSGTFTGNVYANKIQYGTTGGYFNGGGISNTTIAGGKLVNSTISTTQCNSGINTNLGYASYYGVATTGGVSPSNCPQYYTVGYQLNIGSSNYGVLVYQGAVASWRWSDTLGSYYLAAFGEG